MIPSEKADFYLELHETFFEFFLDKEAIVLLECFSFRQFYKLNNLNLKPRFLRKHHLKSLGLN